MSLLIYEFLLHIWSQYVSLKDSLSVCLRFQVDTYLTYFVFILFLILGDCILKCSFIIGNILCYLILTLTFMLLNSVS